MEQQTQQKNTQPWAAHLPAVELVGGELAFGLVLVERVLPGLPLDILDGVRVRIVVGVGKAVLHHILEHS